MLETTALLTDHYELTMVQAAMGSGTAFRRSVFELFPRRLPEGRRYGVVAGTGRALDAVENFRFDDETVSFLREAKVVNDEVAQWLSTYRFGGDIWGYPDGEIYFPGSPIMWSRARSPRPSFWRRSCSASSTTTPPSPRPRPA